MNATDPHRSGSVITHPSSDTNPSASGNPPTPTELIPGSFSIAIAATSHPSSAEPPEFRTAMPGWLPTGPNDHVLSMTGCMGVSLRGHVACAHPGNGSACRLAVQHIRVQVDPAGPADRAGHWIDGN